MNARDEFEGAAAELALNRAPSRDEADHIIVPPPSVTAIPADYLDAIRGRSVTVASFQLGGRTPTHHRGLRAWSEAYQTARSGRDPFGWRVDVVTEDAWWRHRLLGARPDRVVSFPTVFVWVDEEAATETPAPWPLR